MSTAIQSLPIHFAGVTGKGHIPAWAKNWNVNVTTLEDIKTTEIEQGIVVIQSREPAELVEHGDYLPNWSKATAAANPYLVVAFAEPTDFSPSERAEVLKLFPDVPQVELSNGTAQLKESVMQSMAKCLAYGCRVMEAAGDPPVPSMARQAALKVAKKDATDALGEAREVIAAVRPLLAPSGRLAAPKVAAAFGMSTAKLGRLIGGSSRQALAKTPDSPAIQDGLRPFERIARLRALVSKPDFLAWLHRTNPHLDEQTPMQIIESGRPGVVADLVESMLTGAPS